MSVKLLHPAFPLVGVLTRQCCATQAMSWRRSPSTASSGGGSLHGSKPGVGRSGSASRGDSRSGSAAAAAAAAAQRAQGQAQGQALLQQLQQGGQQQQPPPMPTVFDSAEAAALLEQRWATLQSEQGHTPVAQCKTAGSGDGDDASKGGADGAAASTGAAGSSEEQKLQQQQQQVGFLAALKAAVGACTPDIPRVDA